MAVGECPDIEATEGEVVTGIFSHPASDSLLNLVFETRGGNREELGVTKSHPFWCIGRKDFVPAAELRFGDQIRTVAGDAVQVVSVMPRPGPERVFNLEVNTEHVFYVGESGLLVHNFGCEDVAHPMLQGELVREANTDFVVTTRKQTIAMKMAAG